MERTEARGNRLTKKHRLLPGSGLESQSAEAGWLDWLRVRVEPETLIAQNLRGWEGHDANLWRKIDSQVFGPYGFAKADSEAILPTAKVPANIKNIKLLHEANQRL